MHLLEQSQNEPPLAVITGIDYHCWPVLVFAPGEHDKCSVNQLCLNLIGCHCFARQVNLKNAPVDR